MKFGSNQNQSDFTPCPEGDHPAVLVDIIDLGKIKKTFQGKEKEQDTALFVFEAHPETETETYLVYQRYSKSLHQKSTFRKHLKGWRGRDLNEQEERDGYDVDILLNKPCLLTIVHNQSGDGNTFANIELIRPLKGKACAPAGTYKRPAKYGPAPYPHLKEQSVPPAPKPQPQARPQAPVRPQPSPAQAFDGAPDYSSTDDGPAF